MADPITELIQRLPELAACEGDIRAAYQAMHRALADDRKMLLCGNGGSAADAEHFAGELLKGFEHPRPLAPALGSNLPGELAQRLQGGLAAIPLTGFTSLRTATASDQGPNLDYAQLVLALGRPGDVLVGISTSGNAANVAHALAAARARDMVVIGLTGAHGGKLAQASDICIQVPRDRTMLIQELHLPIYHALSLALENALFGRGPMLA